MAKLSTPSDGRAWPSNNPDPIFMAPATSPLRPAISMASLADTLRVRLLSMAQHRQARAIRTKPNEASPYAPGVHASIKPPATMQIIPDITRRSKFSWKMNHASSAVKTASRFSKSDAVDAALLASPYIRATGPTKPPKKMAPASQTQSARRGRLIEDCRAIHRWRPTRTSNSPRPDPTYSSPASKSGGTVPTRTFARGVLVPKSTADPSATITPLCTAPPWTPALLDTPPSCRCCSLTSSRGLSLAMAASSMFLQGIAPARPPEHQIVGGLEHPAGDQRQRYPTGGEKCAAQCWAQCRRKASRHGSKTRRRRSLWRRHDRHDVGGARRHVHLRQGAAQQQQGERPSQFGHQRRKHEADVSRNVREHHRVQQANAFRHPRCGQLRCGAEQSGPEEKCAGLRKRQAKTLQQ